jgi:hypothetical protein
LPDIVPTHLQCRHLITCEETIHQRQVPDYSKLSEIGVSPLHFVTGEAEP